jgi:hypothetical protein
MTVHDYCLWLQQLANSLADCDAPVFNWALVHQLIQGLNLKFSVLKTVLPLHPWFPSFTEARDLVRSDETSRDADSKCATETTLLAAGAAALKADNPPPAQPPPDRSNYTNNNNSGRGRGCGRGGGGLNSPNFNTASTWFLLLHGDWHGVAHGVHPGPAPRVLMSSAPIPWKCRLKHNPLLTT